MRIDVSAGAPPPRRVSPLVATTYDYFGYFEFFSDFYWITLDKCVYNIYNGRHKVTIITSRKALIMDFIWNENYPIAIHVSDEGLYPQLQSLANHHDLLVRYLPTNEDYYPQ